MKIKILKTALWAFALFWLLSPRAFANTNEFHREQLEASGANELSEYLSEETSDYLKKLGCDDPEFDKLLDVSPGKVLELFVEMLKNGFFEPFHGMIKSVGAVLMVSVISGFFPDDEKSKTVLNLACGCFIIISISVSAVHSVKAAVSAIGACAVFEKALIPVLAAIVTVSGNPMMAVSFQGAAFAAAQFIESLAENFVMPLAGISTALGVTGAILPTLKLSAVSDIIRKTMTTVLATAAGLFTAFLGMKSLLSSGADSLAVKGVKMASSTFVPLIGGALGEAYTSVIGSLSLMRTTVGIYGIIVFLVIGVPIVLNLALWALSVRFSSAVSDLLNCGQCSEILKYIGFLFSTVNTVLVLCMAVFIITAGITVLIKSGG